MTAEQAFVREDLKQLAELLEKVKIRADAAVTRWFNFGYNVSIANDATEYDDGDPTSPVFTGADIHNLMAALVEYQGYHSGGAVSNVDRTNVINKLTVRSARP